MNNKKSSIKKIQPLFFKGVHRKLRVTTDIGIIAIITIIILPIYPYTNPVITACDTTVKIDSARFTNIINRELWCAEVFISGDFKNKWIKNGYIDSISIIPQFLNPNVMGNKNYVSFKLKFLDKNRIAFLQKEHITASILFYYSSPTYFQGKSFKISFFDNNSDPIKDNSTNSPAHLYFSYYEKREYSD